MLGGRRESEPPPETNPSSPTTEGRSSTGSTGSGPRVELERVRTSGNFLVPDVKVEAVLSGVDLAGALIVVKDEGGRERYDSVLR